MCGAIQRLMCDFVQYFAAQPHGYGRRFSAMIPPSLTGANLNVVERAALEDMAIHGPSRSVSAPIRGRLALYKLIDETPEGWSITALGRRYLQTIPPAADTVQDQKKGSPRSGDNGRHYGKKIRDTSWFG